MCCTHSYQETGWHFQPLPGVRWWSRTVCVYPTHCSLETFPAETTKFGQLVSGLTTVSNHTELNLQEPSLNLWDYVWLCLR